MSDPRGKSFRVTLLLRLKRAQVHARRTGKIHVSASQVQPWFTQIAGPAIRREFEGPEEVSHGNWPS